MINKLLAHLEPKVKVLEWVDKYGGIVQSVTKAFEGEDGIIQKTFPVTSHFDEELEQCEGFYLDMIPDSSRKSVVYWEAASGLNVVSTAPKAKRKFVLCSIDFRCIAWVNLPKLNLLKAGDSWILKAQLIAALDTGPKPATIHLDQISFYRVKFKFAGEVLKESIFTPYSYDNPENLLLQPYDYFAYNVKCTFMISLDCFGLIQGAFEEVCYPPAECWLLDIDGEPLADPDGENLIDIKMTL